MRRRDVVRLLVLTPLAPLVGCGGSETSSFSCPAPASMSTPERAMRTSQEYTDTSPQPDRDCGNCRYHTPAPAGECGACQLVRGPIHPDGYCNLWTARA
jgi:hypothetical protein